MGEKHGKTNSRAYVAWENMIARCTNPKHPSYKNYGARGVKICERWMKFTNFYADMGDPPDGMSLDRIDNEGGYCPENCRWANTKVQAYNKRTTILLEIDGETKTLLEWSEHPECTVSPQLIRDRLIEKNWAPEDAVFLPKMTTLVEAFGETKTILEWIKDKRCVISGFKTLKKRLEKGIPPEDTITAPHFSLPQKARERRKRK